MASVCLEITIHCQNSHAISKVGFKKSWAAISSESLLPDFGAAAPPLARSLRSIGDVFKSGDGTSGGVTGAPGESG